MTAAEQERARQRRRNWTPEQRERNRARLRVENETTEQRLARAIKSRLWGALRQRKINHSCGLALKYLGCTLAELKSHLEARFQPMMSWDNYGSWHIDHVVPFAKFDLTDMEQLVLACHYTNLQPLWGHINCQKSKKGC